MSALRQSMMAAMVIGAVTVGGAGSAWAGADDGGAKAFFDESGPGSARGMASPAPAQGPDATNAAAGAQPNASVVRTGVAQGDRPATRPFHVAVTRMGHAPAPHGTRVAGTGHRLAHHGAMARSPLRPAGSLEATHRHAGGESHQS